MTHCGMFIFVLLVVASVMVRLTYLRLRKHQAALRLREEEVERYELARLLERESAEREYAAMLIRMDVSDRWFRHAWPLTQVSLMWVGPQVAVSSAVPAALRYAAGEISRNGIANVTCGCTEDAARPLQPVFYGRPFHGSLKTVRLFFQTAAGTVLRPACGNGHSVAP